MNTFFDTGIKSINHNNFTGPWLTPIQAVWHPQRDDVCIFGSMEQPRWANARKIL